MLTSTTHTHFWGHCRLRLTTAKTENILAVKLNQGVQFRSLKVVPMVKHDEWISYTHTTEFLSVWKSMFKSSTHSMLQVIMKKSLEYITALLALASGIKNSKERKLFNFPKQSTMWSLKSWRATLILLKVTRNVYHWLSNRLKVKCVLINYSSAGVVWTVMKFYIKTVEDTGDDESSEKKQTFTTIRGCE